LISAISTLDLDVEKRAKLKWNLEKQDEGMVESIHLAHDGGPVADSGENDTGSLGSIKC
jgi:hypothetical protein